MRKDEFPNNCQIGEIDTMSDVRRVLAYLLLAVGGGFHPDDSADMYVDHDGKSSFTKAQAKRYNTIMRRCRDICEANREDICDVSLTFYKALAGAEPEPLSEQVRDMEYELQDLKNQLEMRTCEVEKLKKK